MRSTLFVVPHSIFGFPLFGFGILLALLVLGCAAWGLWLVYRRRPAQEFFSGLPIWLIAAGIVAFILPNVELRAPDGTPLGMPVRGYGVMVLLGLLLGISLSVYRGRQLGIEPDVIIGLGFWMMLAGVVGARIFYVVQKWNEFEDLASIVKLTEGGLVIYGGVIGGLLAGSIYCQRYRLPVLATADLVAPGFLIGLSMGRIGCLLHGCCFGGVCDAELPSITFPVGSAAYQTQLADGQLLGIETSPPDTVPARIARVVPASPADAAKVSEGQQLETLRIFRVDSQDSHPAEPPSLAADVTIDGHELIFWPRQLPGASLPVHPSQIYAAINALLLCLLIWLYQPFPTRDGTTFCVAILLYSSSRFLLEGVRSDEAGQLGTPLTISQLVAIVSGCLAILGLVSIRRFPAKRTWRWREVAN